MKKPILLVVMLMGASCASKPVGPEGAPTAPGKATRHGQSEQLELFSTLISGQESTRARILASSEVLSCLRSHLEPADSEFSVSIHLPAKGPQATSTRVTGAAPALRVCLEAALALVKEAPEPFEMRISRTAVAGKKAQPFLLPLKGGKKFE